MLRETKHQMIQCLLSLVLQAPPAAAGDRRGLRHQGLHVQFGRDAARAEDPLPHARHAEEGRAGHRPQRRADHARHGRHGRPVHGTRVRRRAVPAGPAARRHEVLHRDARRHRPRQVEQAERRPAREVSALRLPGHADGGARAADRGPRRQPPAAGDGHVDGRHAHVAVGRALAGLHGRADAARQRARRRSPAATACGAAS